MLTTVPRTRQTLLFSATFYDDRGLLPGNPAPASGAARRGRGKSLTGAIGLAACGMTNQVPERNDAEGNT